MIPSKSPFSSIGVWGAVTALLALWLGPDDARTLAEQAERIVTSVAVLAALYGRLRATQALAIPAWVPILGRPVSAPKDDEAI